MTRTLLEIATAPTIRSEKDEEAACDNVVCRAGADRKDVVRFSQSRASRQSPGISDRRYRVRSSAFWWEVKADDGRLSDDQILFLSREMDCGEVVGCGNEGDLIAFLQMLAELDRANWHPAVCRSMLEKRSLSLIARWSMTYPQRRKYDAGR